MKAAVCYGAGKPLVVEEVDLLPTPPGEVRVKLAAVAICHSDIHGMRGQIPMDYPGIAGHEAAGHIVELGKGVTSVKVGDTVVVSGESSGCGHCTNCMMGMTNFCQTRKIPKQDIYTKKGQLVTRAIGTLGQFAEYTQVMEDQVVKIPDDMPLDRACLLSCAVITGFGAVVNRAKVKAFDSCAIIGTGGVGLNAIQGAAFSGGFPVVAVDVLDNKLEASLGFGATHTVNSARVKDPIKAVKDITGGRGVDFVFMTVGSLTAVRQGFSMLAPRGMMVLVGIAVGDMSNFRPSEFIHNESMITGAKMGSSRISIDIPRYVALYKAGRLKLDELISGRYPLEKINEAIVAVEKGEALRNVIVF
jgi:S-(hydroxymethyl)glutathione dehydrogenase / alcohol dehydrogenase